MKANPMRFGVIGLGNIGQTHIGAIQDSGLSELVAVCSRSDSKVAKAQKKYGVNGYQDYSKMLEQEDLDAVCVCTPSGFHLEPALAAAKSGKHVLVEKPLEITRNRCIEISNACKEEGVALACVFQNRYNPEYKKVRKAVHEGKLGKLVLGNAYIKWFRGQAYYDATDWRGTLKGDGGAALMNQSIHTIDLLLDLMGPVKSVMGRVKTLTHDIEGEDIGTAILEFENGALGTIEGSTSIYSGYPEKLEVHGTKGNIIMEGGTITQWQVDGSGSKVSELSGRNGSSDPMAIDRRFHQYQLEEFIQFINAGKPPNVQGVEAMASVALIEAIYESSKNGKRIVLGKGGWV